jgi:hypothetical protein
MINIDIKKYLLQIGLIKPLFFKCLPREWRKRLYLLVVLLLFSSCTFLSNKYYVESLPDLRRIHRVVVFLQRWPAYSQLAKQNVLGGEFIRRQTQFAGAFKPAARLNPRAVDITDIDDEVMGELVLEAMEQKGYQPFLSKIQGAAGALTVEEIMARYQALDGGVDAFVFCFYSPTLYFSDPQMVPGAHGQRSYNLQELVEMLQPTGDKINWAGPRAGLSPRNSISHAFIYISITCFRALDWKSLWQLTDSQAGGKIRRWVPLCPPAPTECNFPADAAMVKRLMCQNLSCRLRHLVPDAF